jgi:hypothetical protein
MKISERIEQRVRNAFGAVIDRDGDRMVTASEGLSEPDAATALRMALYVVGFVVNDIYRDGASEGQLLTVARQIVDTEADWVQLDPADIIARILGAASKGDMSLGGVREEDLAGNVFVSGGHLLGAFSLEGQPWWKYLNEIWAALGAEPGQ